MDNVVSIFTKKEPCKYMAEDDTIFIKSYMNDVLHSFNCHDCQQRYAVYLKKNQHNIAKQILSGHDLITLE